MAYFPEVGGYTDTTIADRNALAGGVGICGPAIIEDPDCTTVVLPGDVVRVTDNGHIIIDIKQ